MSSQVEAIGCANTSMWSCQRPRDIKSMSDEKRSVESRKEYLMDSTYDARDKSDDIPLISPRNYISRCCLQKMP